MELIIIIILVAIFIAQIWNIIALRSMKHNPNRNNSEMQNEKYFELKYRLQYMTAAFSVIIVAIGFFGYKTYSNAIDNIKSDLSKQLSEYSSSLEEIQGVINSFQNFSSKYEADKKDIEQNITRFKQSTSEIQNEINEIKDETLKNPNLYIILEYAFELDLMSDRDSLYRINFSDLQTFDNKPLPNFKFAPIIAIPASHGFNCKIQKVTNNYFEFDPSASWADPDGLQRISIWIASME